MSNLDSAMPQPQNEQRLVSVPPVENACPHVSDIGPVTPSAEGCEDCLKTGDSWVHLRLCMTCGYVGCCDNSKNTHATKHYRASGHPIIRSFEPGEEWLWCYIDEEFMV